MSQGPYSSVMLIATDGLLQNQGLAISGNLTVAITAYTSTTAVSSYLSILSTAFANVGIGNNQITTNTFSSLQSLGSNTLPAITDAVPSAYANSLPIGNSVAGFSGIVSSQANLILGNGDLGKFAQVYGQCQGYIVQNNPIINSVKNSTVLDTTFTSMNSITTGGISDINRTLPAFGADLAKLGTTWALNKLPFFGFPWILLYQMSQAGGIMPELTQKLINNGVTIDDLSSIQRGSEVAGSVDLLIYKTMTEVTGDLLEQVKVLLSVTTANLTTMADLLNPVMSLPGSYLQLTNLTPTGTDVSPTATVLSNVYISAATVNSNLLAVYGNTPAYLSLSKIIPTDQALASQAISNSLQQVKNIFQLTLPVFSTAVAATETNSGLGNITALTQPVPASVASNINSTLATGTGPNGTLTLFDFMGATAGVPYTAEFTSVAGTINSMQAANSLYTLTNTTDGVYTVMQNTLAGDYTTVIAPGPPVEITITIPGGFPGAGTYGNLDLAFSTGLIPAAANLIANVAANNVSNATSLNTSFTTMAQQLSAETNNLVLAQVSFTDLAANSRTSIMSLASSLHDIGTDVAPKGQNDFFTAITDTNNQYGQAIIASFREGRNIKVFDNAGIGSDTQIPATSA
jgi:hypothetical protein